MGDPFQPCPQEYRELQPYFYADFYPVLSYSLSDESWTVWQWDRPERRDGIVLLMRREASPFSSMSLHGIPLDSHATYDVEFRPGYERQHVRKMRGSELKAMTLDIPSTPGSMLILYQRVD